MFEYQYHIKMPFTGIVSQTQDDFHRSIDMNEDVISDEESWSDYDFDANDMEARRIQNFSRRVFMEKPVPESHVEEKRIELLLGKEEKQLRANNGKLMECLDVASLNKYMESDSVEIETRAGKWSDKTYIMELRLDMVKNHNEKLQKEKVGRHNQKSKKNKRQIVFHDIDCVKMERMADRNVIHLRMKRSRQQMDTKLVNAWNVLLPKDGSGKLGKKKKNRKL